MKILAMEKENKAATAAEFERWGKEEAQQVWHLYKSEKIREIYFRGDKRAAVIMLECEGLDEARVILSQLPFVKNKLIDFDIIPLIPYDGFERLFG
jgi:hypothetical protein